MLYKTATATALVHETTVDDWYGKVANNKEAKIVVGDLKDSCIYLHGTILASVDLEKEGGHYITKESERFINDNGDCFPREEVLSRYQTFKTHARTYVEHQQGPEYAKGRCIDVVVRDMGDTALVDVLFTVDKKHEQLVHNITSGIVTHLSMGCQTEFTKCSICGKVAHNESEYCTHVKNSKRQMLVAPDGKLRKAAELCYNNTWIDVSCVLNPAFGGAAIRHILGSEDGRKVVANVLNDVVEPKNIESTILKAASKLAGVMDVERKREEINSPAYVPYHPINNDTSDDTYPSEGYAPIPYDNPNDTKDEFDSANEGNESRVEGPQKDLVDVSANVWGCHKCGHTQAHIKRASDSTLYICSKCKFVEESPTNKVAKTVERIPLSRAISLLESYTNPTALIRVSNILSSYEIDITNLRKAVSCFDDVDKSERFIQAQIQQIDQTIRPEDIKKGLELYILLISQKWSKADVSELIREKFPHNVATVILDEARLLRYR